MPTTKMSRDAARAKAREALKAMTEDEDKAITAVALTNPDALPLDEDHLARMLPASAADAANIRHRLRGRPRVQTPSSWCAFGSVEPARSQRGLIRVPGPGRSNGAAGQRGCCTHAATTHAQRTGALTPAPTRL